MSKWFRRGSGQNNSNHNSGAHYSNNHHEDYVPDQSHQQPSQGTDMMPGAATATTPYPSPPPPQSSVNAYNASSGAVNIGGGENNNYHGDRGKPYHSHYKNHVREGSNAAQPSSKGSGYHHETASAGGRSSRSGRSRHSTSHANGEEESRSRHRSRSNRSNASGRSSSNRSGTSGVQQHQPNTGSSAVQYHYSSSQQQQVGPSPAAVSSGATNATRHESSSQSANRHHYHGQAPSSQAPQQYSKSPGNATPGTPPDSSQSSYPPQVSSSTSSQPSSHRRPAYLLHRDLVIGKGSYGQVCIASRGEAEGHSSGGRGSGKRKKFACKCVVLRNDPKYIAKLQEEVNVLRELRGHENVIRLYDVFCVDNELFIITELGRGGDLFHLLTTHPKHGVTEAYAAKTVAQMLSAVAFLHSRHICHRDLKLENWVLESGKDVWSPLKLIDFGLSTHFTPGHRLSRVVGSSYYVAPEVLKKSYSEACDLWSLGVIVYMLLSGAPPFYGKNDEAIKASIVQGEYTFPHELFRDVSDEAMAFVSTLLSYNTEYRYTAEQALTHPWLAANLDPEALQRSKDGARGVGPACAGMHELGSPEPMQM